MFSKIISFCFLISSVVGKTIPVRILVVSVQSMSASPGTGHSNISYLIGLTIGDGPFAPKVGFSASDLLNLVTLSFNNVTAESLTDCSNGLNK